LFSPSLSRRSLPLEACAVILYGPAASLARSIHWRRIASRLGSAVRPSSPGRGRNRGGRQPPSPASLAISADGARAPRSVARWICVPISSSHSCRIPFLFLLHFRSHPVQAAAPLSLARSRGESSSGSESAGSSARGRPQGSGDAVPDGRGVGLTASIKAEEKQQRSPRGVLRRAREVAWRGRCGEDGGGGRQKARCDEAAGSGELLWWRHASAPSRGPGVWRRLPLARGSGGRQRGSPWSWGRRAEGADGGKMAPSWRRGIRWSELDPTLPRDPLRPARPRPPTAPLVRLLWPPDLLLPPRYSAQCVSQSIFGFL
jgi:hypothetical protein